MKASTRLALTGAGFFAVGVTAGATDHAEFLVGLAAGLCVAIVVAVVLLGNAR